MSPGRAEVHDVVAEGLSEHGTPHRTLPRRDRGGGPRVVHQQLRLLRIHEVSRGGESMDPVLGTVHECIVPLVIHHHDPHVHAVDDAGQQLLGGGRGVQQRILFRERLGQAPVLAVHHLQATDDQQPDLQHSEGQEQGVGQGQGVDVRRTEDDRAGDQGGDGEGRDPHPGQAQPGRHPQARDERQQGDRHCGVVHQVPHQGDRDDVQQWHHRRPAGPQLVPADHECEHGGEGQDPEGEQVRRGDHQFEAGDRDQQRQRHHGSGEVELLRVGPAAGETTRPSRCVRERSASTGFLRLVMRWRGVGVLDTQEAVSPDGGRRAMRAPSRAGAGTE